MVAANPITIEEYSHKKSIHLSRIKRIHELNIDNAKLEKFFDVTNNIGARDLEYIPYNRFIVANELNNIYRGTLKNTLLNILKDYETGAFLVSIHDYTSDKDKYLKFSTAITHLLGLPNIDLLSGKYYATFIIENNPVAPINLLRPYENFKFHTDGAFMKERTDWILFMKMEEENVIGGKTKLLHMEDWNDFQHFYHHELGNKAFKFAGPPPSDTRAKNWGNHRLTDTVSSPILSLENRRKTIRFVDQFIHPQSLEEAEYIAALQDSLEESKNIVEIDLPPGSLLVINNQAWVHGRNKFEVHKDLKRELMRQRGVFNESHK